MGRPDWQLDIDQALKRDQWALAGPNRVIKIVPLARATITSIGGYITLVKYVVGKSPQKIEKDLGLPTGHLSSGLRAYALIRLPLSSEYEHELTTKFPGGLHYNPAHFDPRYGPGAAHIHQWRIRDGVKLPVDMQRTIDVPPSTLFPR